MASGAFIDAGIATRNRVPGAVAAAGLLLDKVQRLIVARAPRLHMASGAFIDAGVATRNRVPGAVAAA